MSFTRESGGFSAEAEVRYNRGMPADGSDGILPPAAAERRLAEARTSSYEVVRMEQDLAAAGSRLVYLPETTSTMDIGKLQGLVPTVVIADHQTAGRGRFSREWQDVAEKDILVTYVKTLSRNVLPPHGSTVLSQLFVLAAWSALRELYDDDPAIQIRWPNDLTAYGQKLGGILLMEGSRADDRQAILFGLGINVHNTNANEDFKVTDYGAISLDEFHPSSVKRGDIVLAVDQELDLMLPDLASMNNPQTRDSYAELWNKASSLSGRIVRISGIGKTDDEIVEGTVVATPFGGGIELMKSDGTLRTIKEFGRAAKLEVIE